MQQEGKLIQIPLAAGNYKPSSGVSFNDCLDGLELLEFSKMEFLAAVTTNNEARQGRATVPVDVARKRIQIQ